MGYYVDLWLGFFTHLSIPGFTHFSKRKGARARVWLALGVLGLVLTDYQIIIIFYQYFTYRVITKVSKLS